MKESYSTKTRNEVITEILVKIKPHMDESIKDIATSSAKIKLYKILISFQNRLILSGYSLDTNTNLMAVEPYLTSRLEVDQILSFIKTLLV